jgi:hypothetical protein
MLISIANKNNAKIVSFCFELYIKELTCPKRAKSIT